MHINLHLNYFYRVPEFHLQSTCETREQLMGKLEGVDQGDIGECIGRGSKALQEII